MLIVDHCDWNRPGADPYTGTPMAALLHYDMPDTTRRRLADRIERRDYDGVVSATRDGITGGYKGMRNMHFGRDRMCNRIDRSKWAEGEVQLGFTYIEDGHHIVVWFICHNVTELVPAEQPAMALPELPLSDGLGLIPLAEPAVASPMLEIAAAETGNVATYPAFATTGYVLGGLTGGACCCLPVATLPAVPEPSTLILFLIGLAAIFLKAVPCLKTESAESSSCPAATE